MKLPAAFVVFALVLSSCFASDDAGTLTILGTNAPASWVWTPDTVKVTRSGAGQYDGFPIVNDPEKPGLAVLKIEMPAGPASGEVLHAGLAFFKDYHAQDLTGWAEKGQLEFWVKGETEGKGLDLALGSNSDAAKKSLPRVLLSKYAQDFRDKWVQVKIPLADLVGGHTDAPKAVNQISFHLIAGTKKALLNFCDMKLVAKP